MKKDEKVKGKKSKEAEEARVVCSISGKKGEHMMGEQRETATARATM